MSLYSVFRLIFAGSFGDFWILVVVVDDDVGDVIIEGLVYPVFLRLFLTAANVIQSPMRLRI